LSGQLVVVSNRVSIPKSKRPAPGGLAVGVLAALEHTGGVWFGWNGTIDDNGEEERTQVGNVKFCTVPLTNEQYEGYYKGYANRVLWPLFHLRLNLVEYQRKYFEVYRQTNRFFAERVAKAIQPDDLVWIHDYHCVPMGKELRELGIDNRLGFFLHIPFPAFDVFRAIPDQTELLRYFLNYDLLGFQAELDRDSFLDTVSRLIPEAEAGPDYVRLDGKQINVGVYPIGLDYDNVIEQVSRAREATQIRRMLDNQRGRQLITGVDRLDYSKGLAHRFEAFEHFLNRRAHRPEEVVYMQIAQPSRRDVPEYQEIKEELDYLAGKINGRFSQYDRIPLHYLTRGFSRTMILGFLSISNVGLITPLRDGMNLVAKEFVACQPEEDPGVLILSRLTGAAMELDGGLMVTPYDIDGVADAIEQALAMPLAERQERWHAMVETVRNNTVEGWAGTFVSSLAV